MSGPATGGGGSVSPAREQRALVESIVASAAVGVGAVVWGALAASDVLVFDGVYMLAGIVLVGVSLLAARAASSEPDTRYPFGRHAATPLAVAMQGVALLATLVYGSVGAVGTILAGGSAADASALVAYGVSSAVLSLLVAWRLRRVGHGSDLVGAEVVAWRAGALLSAGVAVGGVVAALLVRAGHDAAAAYFDPALVLVATAVIGPLPVRLVRDGVHELLEGAPPPATRERIAAAVTDLRDRFDLPAPVVRATKLGRRLYVDLHFVVPPGRWDVDDEDRVRHAATDRLQALPYEVWATVELTTDPMLAA